MSVTLGISSDMTGAFQKVAILKRVPAAFTKNANEWAADTIRYIQNAIKGGGGSFGYFKSNPNEIANGLGHKFVSTGAESGEITLGTGGFIGKSEVVYAAIQEYGGVVHAKDKFFSIANIKGRPRIGPFLAIPVGKAKGAIPNYANTFNIRTKAGNFVTVQKSGKGILKVGFVLKSQVTLPARHWFSAPIAQRMPELNRTMTSDAVWASASMLANKASTGTSWGAGG